MRDGDWAGQSAYLVGGGPSLRTLDWGLLADRSRVLAINRAFLDCPKAAAWFSEDLRVIELYHGRPEWARFGGAKLFHSLDPVFTARARALDPGLQIVECRRRDKYWSRSLAEGLCQSSNSGVGAINLACILGADPIYLLGFDCRGERGRESNYHQDYESAGFDRTGDHQYQSFASDFEHWVAPNVRDRRVINLVDPRFPSRLSCWPQEDRDRHLEGMAWAARR